MLGGYSVGILEPRPETQRHSELARYLRLEYGGRMNVSAFLAGPVQESERALTNGWTRIRRRFRALGAAIRSTAARRSEVSGVEV